MAQQPLHNLPSSPAAAAVAVAVLWTHAGAAAAGAAAAGAARPGAASGVVAALGRDSGAARGGAARAAGAPALGRDAGAAARPARALAAAAAALRNLSGSSKSSSLAAAPRLSRRLQDPWHPPFFFPLALSAQGKVTPSTLKTARALISDYRAKTRPESEPVRVSSVDLLDPRLPPRSFFVQGEDAAVQQPRRGPSALKQGLAKVLVFLLAAAVATTSFKLCFELAGRKWREASLPTPPSQVGEAVGSPPPPEAPLPLEETAGLQQPSLEQVGEKFQLPAAAPEAAAPEGEAEKLTEPGEVAAAVAGEGKEKAEQPEPGDTVTALAGEGGEKQEHQLKRAIGAGEEEEKEAERSEAGEASNAGAGEGEEGEEKQLARGYTGAAGDGEEEGTKEKGGEAGAGAGEEVGKKRHSKLAAADMLETETDSGLKDIIKGMLSGTSFKSKGVAFKRHSGEAGRGVFGKEKKKSKWKKEKKKRTEEPPASPLPPEEEPSTEPPVSTLPPEQEEKIIDAFKAIFVTTPPGENSLSFLKGPFAHEQFINFLYRFEKDLNGGRERHEEARRRIRVWTLFKMQMATLANLETTARNRVNKLHFNRDLVAWQEGVSRLQDVCRIRKLAAGLWAALAEDVGVYPHPDYDDSVHGLMKLQEDYYEEAAESLSKLAYGADNDKPFKADPREDPRLWFQMLWTSWLPQEEQETSGWVRYVIP
ncbi:hypothetical protein ACSSS7_004863 [Eimeria intestinalis]